MSAIQDKNIDFNFNINSEILLPYSKIFLESDLINNKNKYVSNSNSNSDDVIGRILPAFCDLSVKALADMIDKNKAKRNFIVPKIIQSATTDSNKLRCYYTNPTSLGNKSEDVQSVIIEHDPDLMFFSETWYKDETVVQFPNYLCFL